MTKKDILRFCFKYRLAFDARKGPEERGWGGLVQMGRESYLFVYLKMGDCIKFCNHFWEGHVFLRIQFSFLQKKTALKRSTTSESEVLYTAAGLLVYTSPSTLEK